MLTRHEALDLEGSRSFLKSAVSKRLSHAQCPNFYPQDLISELSSSVLVQLLSVFYEKKFTSGWSPQPTLIPTRESVPPFPFFPATPSCCS